MRTKIHFKDREISVRARSTPVEIAKELGVDLKGILVAKVNGVLVDLYREINEDCSIEFLDFNSKGGKQVFWHSSSHLMAIAIKELHPEALLGIGPAIDEGFYYDFYNLKLGDNDLPTIENRMKEIAAKDLRFLRKQITKEEGKKLLSTNKFKMELLDQMNGEITVYETGDFIDLCRGPHIPSAKLIKGIKLTKVAGAYWRGDSKREVMTRVYGVTFPSTRDLDEYLKTEAERGKHDHKKIGKELELFETSSLSPGSPFFLPKGAIVYNELLKLAREMDAKYGYQEIITPIMAKSDVWKTSGHYEKYRENMYRVSPFSNEEEEYALKPMNCPFSTVVFKSKTRSYRELPLRFADYGFLHRYELEGTLDGLFRTRLFEQNDAHIFATKDQVEDEIIRVFELMEEVYSLFKFVPIMTLATRPKERIGTEEEWDLGESILKKVLERKGYKYTIKEGDGAFYGPKIDVYVLDFTGRPESAYTVFTVQIDFNLARRFDVKYIGSDNKEHVPIVIHRAVMGSIGRFLGIILENTAGDLPLWLSPTQVAILTVTDKNVEYARKIKEILSKCGLRAELDDSNATLDYKVREKQLKKIPYLAIAGEKEEKAKTIAIRDRKGKVKYGVNPEEFASKCADSISARALDITV